MQTLIFSSKQYKPVYDLTRPYIQGEFIEKGLPDNKNPTHWGTVGFNEISKITARYCLDELNRMNEGEVLFYCDSDVLLFEHPQWFADQIGDHDFICQNDKGTADMGFFVVKSNAQTKKVIEDVINSMDGSNNFQVFFNRMCKDYNLKIDLFKESDVWNYGVIGRMWNGEEFEIPDNLKAFHANFTVGIENKIKLLTKAIKQYETNTINN